MQMSDPTPPAAEPVRVVRVYRLARIMEVGSAEHRRARYRGWATTTWFALALVVTFLLLCLVAWAVTHDWLRG